MTYYLDTSALVKIYHQECGSDRMLTLYRGADDLRVSELSRLEFVSVVMRRIREGQTGETAGNAVLEKFADDSASRYQVLALSSTVFDEAARILIDSGSTIPVRTLDALQFAFYRVHCDAETIFVCADRRLRDVAEAQGYPTLNPLTA